MSDNGPGRPRKVAESYSTVKMLCENPVCYGCRMPDRIWPARNWASRERSSLCVSERGVDAVSVAEFIPI